MVSGVLIHFVLSHIFQLSTKWEKWMVCYSLFLLEKVNFFQVYNKLEVSTTFYKFSGNFFLFAWPLDQYWEVLISTQWIGQLTRSVSRVSCIFQAISQDVTRFCSVLYKLPLDLASLQSSRRRSISKLCFVVNFSFCWLNLVVSW